MADSVDWSSGPQHQLWLGNVPGNMSEDQLLDYLGSQCGWVAPPYKLVLVDGGQGEKCGVASWRFHSSRWAFKDLLLFWPTTKLVLMRCDYTYET